MRATVQSCPSERCSASATAASAALSALGTRKVIWSFFSMHCIVVRVSAPVNGRRHAFLRGRAVPRGGGCTNAIRRGLLGGGGPLAAADLFSATADRRAMSRSSA